jgi:hypothetical protein
MKTANLSVNRNGIRIEGLRKRYGRATPPWMRSRTST